MKLSVVSIFYRNRRGSSICEIQRFFLLLICILGGIRVTVAAELLHSRFSLVLPDLFPTNDVRNLFQDSEGYIWMGTDCGLIRYDGYDLVTYDQDMAPGIGFNAFVNTVAEDKDNNIWIGTEYGLFTLDKTSGTISAADCKELADDNVTAVYCDTGNGIWVAGEKGLFRKGPTLRKFFSVDLRADDDTPVSGITSIIKDRNVCLWIVARSCGLLRYDIREKKTYIYDDPLLRQARVVFCDSAGTIWVGTAGSGLLQLENPYSPNDLKYIRYYHTSDERSLLDDSISDIVEDKARGILWIGTHCGLSVLHDKGSILSFENFKSGLKIGDLPYNNITSLLLSHDGQLWVAMEGGGICKTQMREFQFLDNSSSTLRNNYNISSILSLSYIGEGNFWLGLPDVGLIQYNIHSGKVQSAKDLPGLSRMPSHTSITSILRRKVDNTLWFATADQGIWIYDSSYGTLHQMSRMYDPILHDDRIRVLREDASGNVWIGTRRGANICLRDGRILSLEEWWGGEIFRGKFDVTDFTFDTQGRIWISVYAGGIIQLDPESRRNRYFSIADGLPDEYVACLCVDAHGSIWAGSSHGIVVCPAQKNGFRPVSSLPGEGRMRVTNILRDSNDRIWVSTANSVYSFSANASGNIENINTYQVAGKNRSFYFNRHSAALLDYSRVAFGGSDGLRIFAGNRVYQRRMTLPLVFTDFKVHNRSLRQMPEAERTQIADKDIAYASMITLDHHQNNFSIDFSVLSFLSPTDNIFQYRLEGMDIDFVTVDWRHRTAFYSNLPAGTYTFRLRVAGSNGVWCSNEKTLSIRISPPPMQSWWAILLYVIAFLGLAYAGFRFARYRIRMKHEIRLSHFEQQQIEELNRVKLQFFTNVTHELMTPLSILITSLEGLNKGVGEPHALYSVMTVNAARLMRLIQQILEFRKAESGNLKLGVSQGDIAAFIRKCSEAFTPLVTKKALHFSFEASPSSIRGWFDPDKVDKIIYNLLSNAAKYTPADGRIGITLTRLDNEVEIEVANSGELMSREAIDNLFKRFYDGKYRKFHTIGTGIGLSLVKDLVTIHKGRIAVTSCAERGNCFHITLPILRTSYDDAEIDDETNQSEGMTELLDASLVTLRSPEPAVCQKEATAASGLQPEPAITDKETGERHTTAASENKHTVMIVEDNENLRELIRHLLESQFRIITAEEGQEAIQLLTEQSVDLVVSDIMMEGMDGLALCQWIKNTFEYCHIPVILLTAKHGDSSRIEGYNSGADGYITKPFSFQVLQARIDNLLKQQDLRSSRYRNQVVIEVEKLDYTSMDEQFLRQAIACVNAHIADSSFSRTDFVREMNTSRTVLTEKLKSLTGLTPAAFVLDIRLRAARELLEKQRHIRVSDLAYTAGFNDPKYFSMCFKKKFGTSPREYAEQHTSEGEPPQPEP